MYNEDKNSKSLMTLKTYYQDKREANKLWVKLFNMNKMAREFLNFLKLPFYIGRRDSRYIKLKAQAFLKPSLIYDHQLRYDFDHSYELNYHSTGKKVDTKVIVYTSIFGNYDPLIEPLYESENCEYWAITDQEIPQGSMWKKFDTKNIPGFDDMDGYHKSKFCKMFPQILFPENEYSVWVDGNVQIVADLYPLVDRLKDSCFIATFQNPFHDCIYTEMNYNICENNVSIDALINQINIYRAEGFPKHFGMREMTIIVRKHNNQECIDMMNLWWNQVNQYTMRDQISFPYIIWKSGMKMDDVQLLGTSWKWSPRFLWYPHNWHVSFDKNGKQIHR